ncbi:MAG: hypothetical protein WDO56_11855 [Gammaproteobacteria bacterium]
MNWPDWDVIAGQAAALGAMLSDLLDFESGIDPRRSAWYRQHLDEPVIDYLTVEKPGRLLRETATGMPCPRRLSVREYFAALGVFELYDADDPGSLRRMQYASINAWGFVGFQVGEAVLIDIGYYRAAREQGRETFYGGPLPNRVWAHGVRRHQAQMPGRAEPVLLTDVNEWCGEFLGRDSLRCFADLRTRACQEAVIRSAFSFNYAQIVRQINETGVTYASLRARSWRLGTEQVRFSVSGMLAAAHLCGARGAAHLLIEGLDPEDEWGVSALSYLKRFAGYALERS